MTLMKSLLLGSAAGIVAVASAQAADLPTKKGAPAAEYVKVCTINVGGKPVIGFTLPGSDTCIKFSGYVTAQVEGGNLEQGYVQAYTAGTAIQAPGATGNFTQTATVPPTVTNPTGTVTIPAHTVIPAQPSQNTIARNAFGYTTRFNFTVDTVSNTAAGPLAAHVELQSENGSGFDNTGTSTYINKAYVTWAGITAGKAPSFFSFTGGGPGWANFLSPDQQGFNQPDLLAYTASFGGGFSATISVQDPQSPANGGCPGGGTNCSNLNNSATVLGVTYGTTNYSYNGMRWPDVVGALKLTQGWGTAQISGVAHNVDVTAGNTPGLAGAATQNTTGWAVDAGVSFNLPTLGAGDQFLVTGAYSENAIWYSGLFDGMWGEGGQVNGNGQQLALADTYYNAVTGGWEKPTAWSVTAEFDHTFTPELSGSLLGSYGEVNWDGQTVSTAVSNGNTWIVGGVGHYDPVKNLDFEIEVLYQNSQTNRPNTFVATNTPYNGSASGVAARFEITRSW
jgi:hypothetical protein